MTFENGKEKISDDAPIGLFLKGSKQQRNEFLQMGRWWLE
jgi:hypothetical protein